MDLQPVVETPGKCPEAVLRGVVPYHWAVEVVRIILGSRLVGLLRGESRPRRQDGVEHARGEALVEDQRLRCSTRDEVAHRVLGGVEDYVRDGFGLIDRRDAHRLYA